MNVFIEEMQKADSAVEVLQSVTGHQMRIHREFYGLRSVLRAWGLDLAEVPPDTATLSEALECDVCLARLVGGDE